MESQMFASVRVMRVVRSYAAIKAYTTIRPMKQRNILISKDYNKIKKPFKISVEGNIGSGKSKLLEYFSETSGVEVYGEPIDLWRNAGGNNLLGLLYEDLNRWNFMFQNYVQLTRLDIQTQRTKKCVQMFERSLQNNRYCFVEMAHRKGFLKDSEYLVLCEYYDWIQKNIEIDLDLTVYLKCPPEVAYERVLQRSRPEERGTVSLDYLRELHHAHEQWLVENPPANVITLDASANLSVMEQQYEKVKCIIHAKSQFNKVEGHTS